METYSACLHFRLPKGVFLCGCGWEYVFTSWKRVSLNALSVFSDMDLFVDIILIDWSLALLWSYLFTPYSKWGDTKAHFFVSSSLVRWYHFHDDVTFWKWPFSLALIQLPPRENIFRRFFPRVPRTSPRWIHPSQASHTLHLHDCNAISGLIYLNLFKILQ